jgi:hypothetical protein
MSRKGTFAAAGAALVMLGAAAKAPDRAGVVQGVFDCRKLADSAARLACYDRTVDAMSSAESKGDLVTIDREQRRAVRRQAFGFSLPSFSIFDRGEKPEEVNRLTARISSAGRDPYGKWVVKLDDGATWVQTESQDLGRDPRKGSSVEINKGLMGAYFMKVDGQAAIKVRRVG